MKKRLLTAWLIACMMISLVGQTPITVLAEGDGARVISMSEGLQEVLFTDTAETPAIEDENAVVEIPEIQPEQNEDAIVEDTPGIELVQDENTIENTPGIELVQNENTEEDTPGIELVQDENTVEDTPGIELVQDENTVEDTPGIELVQDENTVEDTPVIELVQDDNIVKDTPGIELVQNEDVVEETPELVEKIVDANLPFGTHNLGDIVRVRGLMPKDSIVEAIPVNVEIEGQDVLLAYDITIYENEEKKNAGISWQPDENGLSVEFISIALEQTEEEVNIWHMEDATETPEYVTAAPSPEGSVEFVAESFSVYVVSATKLTSTIVASDGNTYEINVTYTNLSGIPMDGTKLAVSELKTGDAGYDEYIEESASKVGTKAENFEFSKVFDIKIVDENDEAIEYEPTGDVDVSIRVIGVSLSEYPQVNVLHFVEDRNDQNFLVYDVDSNVNGETVEFTTDSFSVYVVVGHEGGEVVTPRVEFHFIDRYTDEQYTAGIDSNTPSGPYNFINTSDEYQTTQILKSGEKLELINDPRNVSLTINGNSVEKYFFGWYVVDKISDTTTRNTSTGRYTGSISFDWTSAPQRISFEDALSITPATDISIGETVNWTLGTASGTGTIDEEGTVHVYLAPLYEDFYFLNFRKGPLDGTSNLSNSLMVRKLVIFGNGTSTEVRIGNVICESPDPTHKIFSGWEEDMDGDNNYTFHKTVNHIEDTTGNLVNEEADSPGHTGYYITVSKDNSSVSYLDLYPKFDEARWIYFNRGATGNGSSYVGAAYRLTNDIREASDNSEYYYFDKSFFTGDSNSQGHLSSRPGYDFGGWYAFANMDATTGEITNMDTAEDVTVKYLDNNGDEHTATIHTTAIQLVQPDGTINNVGTYSVSGDSVVNSEVSGKILFTADGTELRFYQTLNDLTLCAKWTAEEVDYTVIFWEQNAENDDYTLAAYKKMSAVAGDVIKLNVTGNNGRNLAFTDETTSGHNVTASLQNTNSGSDYYLADLNYIHYKTYDGMGGDNNNGVVIDGDGNTIINVYYDRNIYTLRFDIGFSTNSGGTWTYQSMTDAEAQTYVGTVYGYVNNNYVELTSDGNGGWTYTGTQNVRNDYTGYRYQTTTSTNGTQYGVVNGAVEELSYDSIMSRTTGTGVYQYSVTTAANTNGVNQYGIFNGGISRVYWRNNNWRQSNANNGIIYTGVRYLRANATTTGTYSGDTYHLADNGFSLTGNGSTYGFDGTYYFPISVTTAWTYNNGANNYGNGTRYLRVENNDADTTYNLGFISGNMQSIQNDAQGWYYNTTISTTLPYDDTLYKYDISGGTNTYYVSNVTNTNYGNNDNYNTFLTQQTVSVGNTDPFTSSQYYTGYYKDGNYKVYYYDITAKYGARIVDRWPDTLPNMRGRKGTGAETNWYFIGWLTPEDAWYWRGDNGSGSNAPHSSIKGAIETMSEEILKRWNGSEYVSYSINDGNGIAMEFHCRYNDSVRKYVLRQYFWDPETQSYPTGPGSYIEIVVSGGSGSTPDGQQKSQYIGYNLVRRTWLSSDNANATETDVTSSTGWSSYHIDSINENGMILNYYYMPNLGSVYYYNQMAHSSSSNNSEYWTYGDDSKEKYKEQYYYGQSLASADQYSDEAQALIDDGKIVGYEFVGWFTNPDGVGSTFDFSHETMVDAGSDTSKGITLYAIYKPITFWVKINPNGGEINRINQNDGYYRNQLYRLGGVDVPLMDGDYMQFENYESASNLLFPGNGHISTGQSTYVNADYGEPISEYEIPRRFVAMSDTVAEQYVASGNKAYYYVNYQLRGTDGESGIYTHIRSAVYLTDEEISHYYQLYKECVTISLTQYPDDNEGMVLLDESTWRSLYVSKEKYRPLNSNETWTFLGWFKTPEGGVEEPMPYNFSDPTTGNFTLTAHWRLDGGYKIEYVPQFVMEDGATINGVMEQWKDPIDINLTYADGAATQIYKAPTDLTLTDIDGTHIITDDSVIFRGWALVQAVYDSTGTNKIGYTPVEVDSNGEITTYYYPNDAYTVSAVNAGLDNTIYFQAVYQYRDSSDRRPKVTNLTLDANGGYINTTDSNELPEWNTYPGTSCIETINNLDSNGNPTQILFGDIQSSAAVRLFKYATKDVDTGLTGGNNFFTHPDNYFLLGFDDAKNENDYIATYAADSIIAITRDDNQTIYAVWEPMVYVTFENNTSGTVTFGLSSTDGALEVSNVKTGLYKREPLSNIGEITLKSKDDPTCVIGEDDVITLAFPKGAEKDITVSGTNNLGPGKVLIWNSSIDVSGDRVYSTDHTVVPGPETNSTLPDATYSHTVGNDTHTHNLASGEKHNLEAFSFTETPIANNKPLTVTFTQRDNAYALLLKDNWNGDGTGGGMQEIDYSLDDITPDTSVNPALKKSQLLPGTSTRFGYSFLGWAYSPSATTPDFLTPDGTIEDLNKDDGFFSTDTVIVEGTVTRTLYGVWEPLKDAVYIHKDVPEPGNQQKPFTFTLNISGSYHVGNNPNTISASNTFDIKHGEYLRIVTTSDNATETGHTTAFVQAEVEVYYPVDNNGTIEYVKDGYRSKTVRWDRINITPASNNGFNADLQVTVTETPGVDYTTSVSLNYEEHDNQLIIDNQTYTKDQLPVEVDTNVVAWKAIDAHGTVIFNNVIDTYDVSVEKRLITNRTGTEDFPFTASYILDEGESYEQTVSLFTATDNFLVTSGETNTVALADIPSKAKLTITELDDDDYTTRYSADNGTNWTDGREVVLTVDSDKAVIYENTLKSYPVTFKLVDQDGNPLQAMFNLTSSQGPISGASGTDLFANTSGVFYTSPEFWVDTYTLDQTTTPTGYISLEGTPVTIDVTGTTPYITSDNTWVTVKQVDDNDITQGFEIIVKNWAQKKVTVKKVLNDVLLTTSDTYKFDFTYSYTSPIDSTTVSGNFSLQPNANVAAGKTRDLIIPANATDLVVTEVTTGNVGKIYDTEDEGVWKNNGTPTAITDRNNTGSIFDVETVTDDATITFINTRKTVDITVVKKLNGTSGSDFEFTAKLEGKAVISDYVLNKGADPNDASDDLKTAADGTAVFTLHPSTINYEDQIILTIPYGSKLTITETQTGTYVTSVGLGNETPTSGLSIVLLSTQTIEDLTVTFTNSEVFVAPTGFTSYSDPFIWIFLISLFLVSGIAVLVYVQVKKKEEE